MSLMMRRKRRSSVDKEETFPTAAKPKKGRSGGRSAKEAVAVETNESVFVAFVRKAGVTLKHDAQSNETTADLVVFQKRIQQQLQKSPQFPGIIQEFISSMEAYIENADALRTCLLPCVPQTSDGDSSSSSSFQESLLRMLLGVETLQTLIINILLEKIPEFMLDSSGDGGLSVPRMIINQLKWLDRIVDAKGLSVKLLELVSVAPVEVQRDIITSLPEILEDSQHNDVGKELNSLLQENTQLTVPVLDALSSLNLRSSLLTEVRSAVMATMAAVQLEDLPVVVKFILQSVSSSDAFEVIQASQTLLKTKRAAVSAPAAAGSSQDSITLVLDAIKSAVRFQKTISEAWLKAIESVEEVEDHKVIDLLMLLILHSTNANQSRRGAERMLKLKVRSGLIQEPLLHRTFRDYVQVVRGYFSSVLALAQSLLRSPDPGLVAFGGHMYRCSFTSFDSYCHQEVVGSLVTHVCSGAGGEVDMALELLCGLVTEKPSEMSLYAVFVKGILDYMDNLTSQQIRKLFHLLSRLAFGQQQQGSHIQDDMHIVIRKQLSSTVPKYKRIGIIGAVMVIGSMGALRPKGAESHGLLSQDALRQVTALMELVKSSSESSPEAAALYYDELANLIWSSTLDPQVQEMIGSRVLDDFQEDFVVDLGPDVTGSFLLPPRVLYNLDEDESQGGIAINLLPLLAKDAQSKGDELTQVNKTQKRVSPLCLSPFFRLLRLCEEKRHQGDLEEIDALLAGCPLILTDMDAVDKVQSLSKAEREFLCALLFHTINWFREVVNAFCKQTETEMKMKVMTRLQNITYLQTLLEKALAETPGFVPPASNFDGESSDRLALSSAVPALKTKKDGGGKKRKAAARSSSEGSSQPAEATEADETQQVDPHTTSSQCKPEAESLVLFVLKEQPEKEKEKDVSPGVSLSVFRPFFRELDLEVLSVLQSGLLSRSLLDSELHTKVREEVLLGPAELVFLLEDLLHKLEFSLTAAPTKRAPFLKPRADRSVGFSHLQQRSSKDIASYCVQLLPALCTHLENCHNHFQALLSENNGCVDGPATDMQEYRMMSASYQLLLQVLNTIFSWSGFSQPGHRNLLKKALGVLAERLKEGDADLTLEQFVKQSFEYLLNFRSTMPSLNTALCLSQLLSTVSEKGGNAAAHRDQTASLVRHFLSQVWVTASGERERGNKFNEALHALLTIYLEQVDDILKVVEEIAGEGITELLNVSKDESSASWPTLNRQTFLVFYKVMLAELEKAVRKIPAGKSSDDSEVSHKLKCLLNCGNIRTFPRCVSVLQAQSEKLLTWSLAVRDFHILVNLVKVFDSRPVLNVCLKYGRLFLESFLKLGMPLLDYSFKRHKEDVQSLLKTFQLSTRQLHHMCGHSKIRQDTSLTNHVPALKKSLELFLYRVKVMLALNNCQEAFWMGNLKNRNLKGEEILSQRSQESDEDEDEEEGQGLPLPQQLSEDEAEKSDSEAPKKTSRGVEDEKL
ncbi:Fanconi anemia group D2 protein [Oryzias melastigma]|uniref:Fanconi anemia group D2 protein n=1 Tax=Oryzias melastigma TaxID=30732 RepID=A0A834CI89_ORYME|nr:Fanconi anemia group D2 protein [Oryzias melastigma]